MLQKEQRIVIQNAHPSIISKEQFEATARLTHKSAIRYERKKQNTRPENHYLGKIFCFRCGKIAVRCEGKQSDRIIFYYACHFCINSLKYEKGRKKASRLSLAELDVMVWEALRKCMDMLAQFENFHKTLLKSDLFRQKRASIVRDIAELERTISNYEQTILMAYTHHLSGLLDIREYRLIREKTEIDKANADEQLAQILKEREKYKIDYVSNNQWFVNYRKFRDDKMLTKEMIQTLISRIFLTLLTNEVRIEFNYVDSLEALRNLMREAYSMSVD